MLVGSHRLVSLITMSLVLAAVSSDALADAGVPPGTGGHAGRQPGQAGAPGEPEAKEEPTPEEPGEAEQESPPESEPTAEEPPPEVVEAPLVAQPSHAPETDGDDPNAIPTRRDFLKRLRSTAESIENVRTGERTRIETEGDLTVLSNVAPLERLDDDQKPRSETREREAPAARDTESGETSEAQNDYAEVREVRAGSGDESEAEARDSEGWSWLWILGGLATMLLVPIGMLLSRATRNT